MKKYLIILSALIFLFANGYCQGDSTVVEVFKENQIHFGDPSKYETEEVKAEDSGRIIYRTVNLPDREDSLQITAHLVVQGAPNRRDDYDRAGSIFLSISGMENIELLKFVTGFCGGKSDIKEDVTFVAPLLRGDCTIKGFIDTWGSPAFQIDFELIYKKSSGNENCTWNYGVFNDQSLEREEVTASEPSVVVNIPQNNDKIILSYFTSGHCTDGRGADEFVSKNNVITIDDQEIHRYKPWRTDCANFKDQNPCGTYTYSRSGWCPGDIVHPLRLDVTNYLTPGEHTIRFAVEDIRPKDSSGRGYWRVSSFLAGWGDISGWQAEKILMTGPDRKIIPTNTKVPFRIDLVDASDNVVIVAEATIEIKSDSIGPVFSTDSENWSNPLILDIEHGSAQFWMQSSEAGKYVISAKDISPSPSLNPPEDITIEVNDYEYDGENYSLQGTATADCECNSVTETAQHAIDGTLETKWCCNNGSPDWLLVTLPDSIELNYFIIRHAGAGQAKPPDPGASDNPGMNTDDFKIQTQTTAGGWKDLVTITDNPGTEVGNITYHSLDTPVKVDQIRLYITDPGGDNAARIYEFEMYNRPVTSVEDNELISSDDPEVPSKFFVYQNYPNPFNSQTAVKLFIPAYGKVKVSVMNSLGQLVANILSGDLSRGIHSVNWNVRDLYGKEVTSGVYFLNVTYTDRRGHAVCDVRKMLYLR